jgi:hypothetical protein
VVKKNGAWWDTTYMEKVDLMIKEMSVYLLSTFLENHSMVQSTVQPLNYCQPFIHSSLAKWTINQVADHSLEPRGAQDLLFVGALCSTPWPLSFTPTSCNPKLETKIGIVIYSLILSFKICKIITTQC